jgi:hypothetical protein
MGFVGYEDSESRENVEEMMFCTVMFRQHQVTMTSGR